MLGVGAGGATLHAQPPLTLADETVTIHSGDDLELRVMVDYVGQALDLRFVYGEELTNQRIVLRPSPVVLPKDRLLSLLAGLLRVRDLVLVQEGDSLYRIVRTEQATRSVAAILDSDTPLDPSSVRMVTQVIPVAPENTDAVADKLARFLSSPKASLLPVPERGLLIVTDYERRIVTLKTLIALLDGGAGGVEIRTVPVAVPDAETLAERITSMLDEIYRFGGSGQQAATVTQPPTVRADILPGQLVIVGRADQVAQAESLVERFATAPVALSTQAYIIAHMSTGRAKQLIDHVVLAPGSDVPPPARIHVDTDSGRLFVTAQAATHQAIAALLEHEDKPLPQARRPLRLYRPRHRKAAELLGTLTQLLGEGVRITPQEAGGSGNDLSAATTRPGSTTSGDRSISTGPPPLPGSTIAAQRPARIAGPDYVLTVDEHTNAILAVGTRAFHAQLAELIDELDLRRPQVLIEMTLVAVTWSDTMDLGVELEALDLGDATDFLLFSNFGLSSIDVMTGQRILTPGVGANGVLIRPEDVPIIIRALATRGWAQVISTPRILVADNAQGVLRNVDEAPFTSVNASDTVATTSFGGFESAGTTLTVTPHIAEGDHLTLEYQLTFSNFTGGSSGAGVPPPRTTNSFSSTVEVPDGYTVVTGGLVVDNRNESLSEVPFLGRIPIVGRFFQSSSRQKNKTKIFAFIRPVILRDDRFADLKFVSLKALEAADVMKNDAPLGEPLWMR